MRIGLVGIALPPIMGGLEVHIWELAKKLAEGGNEVHVFGVRSYRGRLLPSFEVRENVLVHRVGGTVTLGRFEFYELAHTLIGARILLLHLRIPFDLLHGHCVYPSGIACRIVKLFTRLPYAITSHGDEIMEFPKNPMYAAIRKWITRVVFRGASRVICVSEELRQLSIKYGAIPERTLTKSNVIDISRFRPFGEKHELRRKLGLTTDAEIILSLRRLSPKNGVQYLVKASPSILQCCPRTLFLVCGDGDQRTALERQVENLGVGDHFAFAGSIPNDLIEEYINASDIAVFPSLAEATSIACLEAMACGLPVIASNVGGLPEIITNGETGILVDFDLQYSTFRDPGLKEEVVRDLSSAIVRLLKDIKLRDRMGVAASEYVHSNHSWIAYRESILHLYSKIARESNAS